MELNEYQDKAMSTCMNTCSNFSYMMLNLVGEVGELASKIAKAVRRETGMMDGPNFYYYKHQDERSPSSEVLYEELQKELGDILWQTAGFAYVMGWTLEEIAQRNLDKLSSRKKRGVIDGDGDNR
mgnify:CR=1 FL=1